MSQIRSWNPIRTSIGKIHLPSYVQPEQSAPLDRPLIPIFAVAISTLAVVLAAFHTDHPVVKYYTDYLSTRPTTGRNTEASLGLTALRMTPTADLEAPIQPPIHALLSHSRLGMPPLECNSPVLKRCHHGTPGDVLGDRADTVVFEKVYWF
ncbi:hypothetical protein FB451DRAFT_1178545 [Mycena latifolia]|nr:hypothetical protein FB451DRAFT_1178545 [Mycena latifolia]